jgi:CubicO group peptidase (beta-lactamase class C family)
MAMVDQITALVNDYRLAQPDMPGLVVGYLQGTTPNVLCFGTTEQNGQGAAPDETTIYEIGSVTKTFTATALAWMVAGGLVRLEDFAQTYVPTYPQGGVTLPYLNYVPAPPGTPEITFLQLADYTPGLPADGPGGLESQSTWADLAAYISNHVTKLASTPGTEYAYVNAAFELLGSILAHTRGGRQSGYDYSALLAALLSADNGFDMPDTVITLSTEQQTRVAPGYNKQGRVAVSNGDWRIKSTVTDMMAWLTYNMNLLEGCPLNDLFPYTRKPYFQGLHSNLSFSLGWWMYPVSESMTRYFKNGISQGGYSSYIAFDMTNPNDASANNGVVILDNLADSKPGGLVNCILDTLGNRPCRTSGLSEIAEAAERGVTAVDLPRHT